MSDAKANENVELKKHLGLFGCVSLVVGSVIGSGIFISPKGVIAEAGSIGLSIIIWILCGILTIFGAESYSELGCMMPKAGGVYEYLRRTFGNLAGFLFIWSFAIISVPAVIGVASLTFSDYVFEIIYPNCKTPKAARILVAAMAIRKARFFSNSFYTIEKCENSL
jgi:amino acid transporter